jgi:hypothetical protein
MDFYNELEQALVNGDIPQKYANGKSSTPKEFDEYCDKKFKADYLTF